MRHTVHLFIHSQSHSLIPQLALPSFPQFILWSENEHGPMLSRMLPARAETKMMVWEKLSRGRFSAQWRSRSKFRADWVSGLWRKGNKWSGAWRQSRISSSPAREGPLPVQGLAAPAVCVSSCERPKNPPCSWSNAEECWRGAVPLWILLKTHGGKAYLQQACFYERRATDGVKIFSCR